MIVASTSRGRLERCELWGNADGGVFVHTGGDPTLSASTFRDHVEGVAAGVYVAPDSRGKATIGSGCFFARNAKGGVVRA